jgi:hypothetical protein
MLKEEMRGHLLTEADRIKNMNASPEDFADYLLKHNFMGNKRKLCGVLLNAQI